MTTPVGLDTEWVTIKSCPLCRSSELQRFETVDTGGQLLTYEICRRCTLVIQNPRMSDEALELFYQDPYREAVQEVAEPIEKDLVTQRARALWLVNYLVDAGVVVRNHLDLGSSAGAFLQATQARFGAQAQGVEPGRRYREHALRTGVPTVGSKSDVDRTSRFDLVSKIHVLEHLPNPVQALSDIREEYLAEAGFLLVEVPNLLGHQALELAHNYAFHAWTLRWTLERAGYELLRMSVHGSFRSPILGLYITALARAGSPNETVPQFWAGPAGVRAMRGVGSRIRSLFSRLAPGWTWQDPRRYIDRHDRSEGAGE